MEAFGRDVSDSKINMEAEVFRHGMEFYFSWLGIVLNPWSYVPQFPPRADKNDPA